MTNTASKVKTLEETVSLANQWRDAGQTVVFTNGCFDILHLGHVDYLEKARNLGHKLVLGINTDASVGRIKGPLRPVVDQYARARLMASLVFVDVVVLFDESTPESLIRAIKPDILVKGNDYSPQNIVGADFVVANGGSVKTIPLVDGYSTSQIIEKIKKAF